MVERARARRATIGLVLMALATSVAAAAETGGVLSDYRVTSWTEQDGLPTGTIWSITQDADGYLWLGTDAGLIRFDGVRFQTPQSLGRSKVPTDVVRALHTARDGSLWVGFTHRGIARLRGEQVTTFGEPEGLPTGAVSSLVQDESRTIWAGTNQGLHRFSGTRWDRIDLPGEPQGEVIVSASPSRSLVVATRTGVFERRAADGTFMALGAGSNAIADVAQDAAGRVWVTDRISGFRNIVDGGEPGNSRNGKGTRLMVDRTGDLWVATFGQGVWRVRTSIDDDSPAIEAATDVNGLSNNVVYALFEDREGNVWAGTSDGLNRLTQPRVSNLMDVGLVTGVERASNGRMWALTSDGVLLLSRTGEQLHSFPSVLARAAHADRDGTLWVGTDRALLQLHDDGRMETAGQLPGQIRSITSQPAGTIVVALTDGRLLRLAGGRFVPMPVPHALERRPLQVYSTRDGTLWVAAAGQLFALASSGTTRHYGTHNGLDIGVVRELFEDRAGVLWVAGSAGLARVAGDRATSVHRRDGLPTESLTGIVQDAHGTLWVGAATGIIRLNDPAFDSTQAGISSAFAMYDSADGVGGTTGWIGQRSVVRSDDGRLWFLTSSGITIVDPLALVRDDLPLPLNIEQVLADDRLLTASLTSSIEPGVSRLQIHFSLPNLTSPRRTRFRYRLEGFDTDWIDSGRQRVATYTNLPPRQYRFVVEASSVGGQWGGATSSWQFTVQPAFYQTFWFSALCVALIAGLTWIAWRLRVLQVRRQFAVMLAERTRLSRELHDTLLQSLVGVALQCDVLAGEAESRPPSWMRTELIRLRKQVESYIRECRQSIWRLRSAALEDRELHQALRDVAERAGAEGGFTTSVAISGTPRPLGRDVDEQLLRIAQEASTNAARHSGARNLRLQLTYGPQSVVLRVDDDGQGFDPADPMHRVNGHYGLVSMRERAESIGGIFSIASSAQLGTSVHVSIPYASSRTVDHEADPGVVHGRPPDRAGRNRPDHQPAA